MVEFRICKSGGSWIAKRTDSSWTSGFQRCEQDAILSATREARFMRHAKIVAVRENGEVELYSTPTPVARRGLAMGLRLG